MDTIHVLHVDDEPDFADVTAVYLEDEDDRFTVETATSASDGLARLTDDIDCIVSDYDMPGRTGIEFLETVRERHPDLPFILFTGRGSEAVASDAIAAGVTDYLQKGTGTDHYTILAHRVANAVEAYRSATEARQRRHRLEQIVKTVPGCVVQLDTDGQFVFANRRAEAVLGLERSEVTDRTYNDPKWDIRDLDGNPIPDEKLPFRQVLDSGEPLYDYRHSIQFPTGERTVLLVNGAPLFDDQGAVESVVFSLTDVTDREQLEAELAATVEQYETLVESFPEGGIFLYDEDLECLLAGGTGLAEHGLSTDDVVGFRPSDRYPPAIAEELEARIREAFEGNDSTFTQTYEGRQYRIRTLPVGDSDGTPSRVMAVSQDITEHKERERDLERYESIVENTEDGIYVFDEDGRFVFVNQRVVEVSGISLDAWIGEHVSIQRDLGTLTEAEVTAVEDGIEAVVRGEETEVRIELTPDVPHDLGTLELRLTPFRTTEGESRVIGFSRNITEQKEYERELERQNERLDEFAGIVSHDLRNPLNVASGRLALLADEYESDDVEAIERAHDRMETLIGDLLALAREGKQVSDTDVVDLAAVVRDCWRTVDGDDATVVIDVDGQVRADESRLQQLLENLMRNAVVHGGEDVTVTVGPLDDGFYVEDDGPGIPSDERDQVFEAGYSTVQDGTGFGLSIVRRVAEAHEWDIRVTEGADGGARFEVTNVDLVP